MLKRLESPKAFEARSAAALRGILDDVPAIRHVTLDVEAPGTPDRCIDPVYRFDVGR